MSSEKPHTRANTIFLWLDKLMLAVSNIALLIILIVICWTVWSRYVLRSPLVWTEDITTLSFVWFIFIGMAAVHNRKGHVGIDIFTSLLPAGGQLFVERLGDVFIAVFAGYVAYLCTAQAIVSHTTAHTTVLALPLSYFFASLAVGFALMAIRSVSYLFGVPSLPDKEPAL